MLSKGLELAEMEVRLARWLKGKMREARKVAVSGLKRASSGLSNETFFLDVAWQDEEGPKMQPMVLRRQPTDVMLYPDYDLGKQYRIMERLANTDIPVPRVYWIEHNKGVLGNPFYLMSKIDGEIAPEVPSYHISGLFYDATPERRRKLCLSGLEMAARVHLLDWERHDFHFLGAPSPGTTEAIDRDLDYYENYLEWAREEPQPILQAALDYLRENKFVPKRTTLCWGDCRLGNMIFADNDEVAGVLDWEMAYLGNPEADLVWFMFMDWQMSEAYGVPRLDGFPSHEEIVSHWENLTGWKAENIFYHEVLAAFKLGVITMKLAKLMKANKAPVPEGLDTNNACTQRLASLLELPPPGEQRKMTSIDEISVVIQTHITGPGGFSWHLVAEKGVGTRYDGTADNPDATTTMSFETWKGLQNGDLNKVEAFMGGLIGVEGDVTLLMQFEDMLNRLGGPPPGA
jgi:aminoglycoside phosphotransferase (APT) family kinase protein